MRALLAVIIGLFFIGFATVFLTVFNSNKTIFDPTYVKNLAEKADLYNKIPQTVAESISNGGDIPPELKDSFVKTVTGVITAQTVRVHLNSLIDQMLSDQIMVSENISDIKATLVNSTDLGFLVNNSKNDTFPESINFDKRQSSLGKYILQKNKIFLISFVGSICLLLLLFFASSRSYKAKFKWLGAFCLTLSFFMLVNYIIFRFVNFRPLINLIKTENSTIQTIDQILAIINIVKADWAKYYLYEFIILGLISLLSFVTAGIIKAPVVAKQRQIKQETKNEAVN